MGRSLLATILATIALVTRGYAQADADSLAVAGEIARLEHRWATALVLQDTAVLQQMLAPEYALIVSASPERPIVRATWLASCPSTTLAPSPSAASWCACWAMSRLPTLLATSGRAYEGSSGAADTFSLTCGGSRGAPGR